MTVNSKSKLLLLDTLRCMVFSAGILFVLFLLTRLINFGAFDLYRLTFKEFSFLDTYYAEDFKRDKTNTCEEIVLVNVQHFNRSELATIIENIQKEQPKVIGVDVIFDHQKKDSTDKRLSAALQPENVVTAFAFQNRQLVKNHPLLGVFRHKLGYANFNFDTYNAVIRNFQAKNTFEGHEYQSFGLRVAQTYLGTRKKLHWDAIDSKSIPINYSGGLNRYEVVNGNSLLLGKPQPILKNKIVLLGYLGTPLGSQFDIEDKHFTPMNKEFLGKSAPDTFGVVVHANIIEMLVKDKMHYIVPNWIVWSIGLLLTFLSLAFFITLNKKSLATYMFTRKITQLAITILFIGVALWLLSNNIYFKITSVIWYIVLSIECIWAYKVFSNYTNKKFGWKSYFFQS